MGRKTICLLTSLLVVTGAFARTINISTCDAFTDEPIADVPVIVKLWHGEERAIEYSRVSDEDGKIVILKKKVENVNLFVPPETNRYCTTNVLLEYPADETPITATVRVCRVGHPVMLKAEEVKKEFPKGCESMSFDMLKGSWLPPLGTGIVADVVFTRLPRIYLGLGGAVGSEARERKQDVLQVKFPGEGNGIRRVRGFEECQLRIRTAPEEGYEQNYSSVWYEDEKLKDVYTWNEFKCMCFRIRTQKNELGEIVGGHYGKLGGDVDFKTDYYAPKENIESLHFQYYVNETPLDRNLEHDAKNDPKQWTILSLRP